MFIAEKRAKGQKAGGKNAIPPELRRLCCWAVQGEDKVPKDAKTPLPANCKDPATLSTFEEAYEALGPGQHLAFCLTGRTGIIGVDLDKCRDPKTCRIEPWAEAVLARLDTYTEVSPSGTGIRMFLRGKLPPNHRCKKGPVEVYSRNKFLSVTGRRLNDRGVEERQEQLSAWHAEVFGAAGRAAHNPTERNGEAGLVINNPPDLDDERLERLFNAKPEAKEIFEGGADYASPSEADLALANYAVAFGWPDQEVCDLLVQARLNAGGKPKHLGYYASTIAKAHDRDGGRFRNNVTQVVTQTPAEPGPEPEAEADGPQSNVKVVHVEDPWWTRDYTGTSTADAGAPKRSADNGPDRPEATLRKFQGGPTGRWSTSSGSSANTTTTPTMA
jgi:primase-polymerase (primpol)-like protein